MKHATLSISILLIFIFVWSFYFYYSHTVTEAFAAELHEDVIINVKSENWDDAYEEFSEFQEEWSSYRRLAHLFFNTEDINGIDLTIVRCESAIINLNKPEAYSELSTLVHQLKLLHENEQLSLANVF